ncbi:MAG: VOC family protein [Caulobacter sp.]|nr:VOC family protein [Caulobacter sp.]
MPAHIAALTLVVKNYDDAIAWYRGCLGFTITDSDLGGGKRWVTATPPGGGCALLLAQAANPEQAGAVGAQTGGRVMGFLHTDDFARDHAAMTAAGVRFLEAPRHEPYGVVAVFEDLYGNRWDLLQPVPD